VTIKLSVCITTYNRAELLDRSLASLSAQTRLPDELIVSDDCSQDRTEDVVAAWRHKFPLLRYNRNPRNLNMPGNLNHAIGLARGDYVANVHDADEYGPALLEKWECALDRYPSAGFVFCGVANKVGDSRDAKGVTLHDVEPFTPGRAFFEKHFLHRFSSIVWGTVMARRAVYVELLPFDSTFGFVSDVDMWMRMCLNCDVAYVREPLLVLDQSPSKEREQGRLNWKWVDNTRRMQLVNIRRAFEGESGRLGRELFRHHMIAQRVYLRRLLGRIRHHDWAGIREGLRYCRNLTWPLRGLGYLVSE
jgi:hypothetical protein